jgi:DtxR family Mn-dependent transcriptional regulator
MVKRLAESGYVEHLPYRGVRLTANGLREALRIVRRHRIIETYLSQRLGYTWDDVHAEAERLEHAASEELIERMATALEFPSHDPHGAPIPTPSGAVDEPDHPRLAEVGAGRRVVVRAVRDDDRERLRYMETRGLVPGALVEVEARAPFNGPIALRVGDGAVAETIGYELASQIRVSYVDV